MGSLADTLTPPGSPPEEPHFEALSQQRSAPEYVSLVKNKSTSNLLSQSRGLPVIDTAKRMSIDAGQLDRMARLVWRLSTPGWNDGHGRAKC
jgi:protein-serine/threonine kinase